MNKWEPQGNLRTRVFSLPCSDPFSGSTSFSVPFPGEVSGIHGFSGHFQLQKTISVLYLTCLVWCNSQNFQLHWEKNFFPPPAQWEAHGRGRVSRSVTASPTPWLQGEQRALQQGLGLLIPRAIRSGTFHLVFFHSLLWNETDQQHIHFPCPGLGSENELGGFS